MTPFTLDPKVVEDLRQRLPGAELAKLSTPDGIFVVKIPETPEFRLFQSIMADGKSFDAYERLLAGAIVYPAPAECQGIFQRRPGLVTSLGAEVARLAGAAAKVEVEKL